MGEQKRLENSEIDSESIWSYGILILILALLVNAWMSAHFFLNSLQRISSFAFLTEKKLPVPTSNGVHQLIAIERAETEGSLKTPFPTTESETPALSTSSEAREGEMKNGKSIMWVSR